VCSRYVEWQRLRERYPGIAVLDAREHPALVGEFRAAGLEINDGMILRLGQRTLYGREVMAELEGRGLADRAYAWLVLGRKVLLRLLGRPPIP
jgi:hypothetical protein